MTLEQMWAYVDVVATTLLKQPVVIRLEDEQITCDEYGVFLSKTQIDRKTIRGTIQIDGWVVETGGRVSSNNRFEEDDYELNEIGTDSWDFGIANLFVTTIFQQQINYLIQSEKIVVTERGASLDTNEHHEIFSEPNQPIFPPNDFPGFMPECPEDFQY